MYQMKTDLYFVGSKDGVVELTDNKMEAAKKYAELAGKGIECSVGILRKAYVASGWKDAYHTFSEAELLKVMTSLVVGKDITPPRPPTIPKRAPKSLIDMSFRDAILQATKADALNAVEKAENSKVSGATIYREMNILIIKRMTEAGGPVRLKDISQECFDFTGKTPKVVSNVMSKHMTYLEETGTVNRIGRGIYELVKKEKKPVRTKTPEELQREIEEKRKAKVNVI
jgi:hypothetical protein